MKKIKTITRPLSMLDINLSLGVNEQKLLNILIHYLVIKINQQNIKPKSKSSLQISVKRFHLHEYLDKENKFKLSIYTKKLNNSNVRLNKFKTHSLFSPIELTPQYVIFTLNSVYNTTLLKSGCFKLDAEIHRMIKKKTSLALYQIILSKLKKQQLDLSKYKVGSIFDIEIGFEEFISLLGKDSYSHVLSSEIFRSVNMTAMKELNELEIGFSFIEKGCCTMFEGRTVKGFLFRIKLLNLEYLSLLLEN